MQRWFSYSAVTVLAAGSLFAQKPPHVQTFPLTDTSRLTTPKGKTEAVTYKE